MKKTFLAVLLAVALLPALGWAQTTLIDYSPDVNNGSLTALPGPGDWQFTQVSGSGDAARLTVDRGGDGDWAMGGSDGSGSSAPREAYYSQSFDVNADLSGPAIYALSLEGWTKIYANWWNPGDNWDWDQRATLELWVDGVQVFSDGSGQCAGLDGFDTWEQITHEGGYTVNTSVEVRLREYKNNDVCGTGGLGAIYWDSRFDDVRLTAEVTTSVEDWMIYY